MSGGDAALTCRCKKYLMLCAYDLKPSAAFLDGDFGLEVNCSCTRRLPQQARIHSVAL